MTRLQAGVVKTTKTRFKIRWLQPDGTRNRRESGPFSSPRRLQLGSAGHARVVGSGCDGAEVRGCRVD